MANNTIFKLLICVIIGFLISSCATPGIYRPEVEMFQKATTEIETNDLIINLSFIFTIYKIDSMFFCDFRRI